MEEKAIKNLITFLEIMIEILIKLLKISKILQKNKKEKEKLFQVFITKSQTSILEVNQLIGIKGLIQNLDLMKQVKLNQIKVNPES